ncbi:alternate-type signal peptide domain-containing protein [Galactobacter valiniphilus]|nr:alternate-type signal peptide domain-containing protein [Galactobacter valiniphilus]
MKKNTQVVLAGAVALGLAAGGGTFALWNSTATLNGGGVTTGKLAVAAGAVSYTDASPDAANTTWLSTYRIVPGDTVISKQDVTVTLVGKNLKADLSLVNATGNILDIPAALASDLTVTYAAVPAGTTPVAGDYHPAAGATTLNLKSGLTPAATDTAVYTVYVKYAFAKAAGNLDPNTTATQLDQTAKLIDTTQVSLTQVR